MKHCLKGKTLGVVVLFVILVTSMSFAQYRIMPLGDSITEGALTGDPVGGYRDDLDALLNNAGINFNFVGTLSTGSGFDTDHEGHNGMRADEIAAGLEGWLNQLGGLVPRFVMVHVGTNDISQDESNASTISDIEDIVDIIYDNASFNNILLCSLIPRNDGKDGTTTELNALIKDLYFTKKAAGYNIFYVGQNEVFKANSNWAADYLEDNVHPTNDGFNVMAGVYYNVLLNAIYTFDNQKPLYTDYFTRGELGRTWAADPEYQVVNNKLANTSTTGAWDYLATYIAQTSPTTVSIEWDSTADAAGIGEGGLALKLDAPSPNANGYLCWYSTGGIRLWEVQNGAPVDQLDIQQSTLATPVAGDVFEIQMSSDEGGHHFTTFINGTQDATLTDDEKRQGNQSTLYAGVMLKGNLNNNINYFDLSGTAGPPPADETPPGTVTDLLAGSPGGNSVSLSWTAVGDDSLTGTASRYDIRYSTDPINNGNFDSATQAFGEPNPSSSGTPETFVVTGLQSNTTYYFALKVEDEVPNISPLSNIATETTIEGDDVPPAAITDLTAGSPTGNSISLSWTAVGDDGTDGTAASYDVRYSTTNINDDNDFDSATQANGEPVPSPSGTPETFVVTGLQASTTYYFAVKVADEVFNISPLSNSASATTVFTAIIYFTDDFNRAELGPDWIAAPSCQIVNNELENTSTVSEWGHLALYKAAVSPVEVSMRWGQAAEASGIEEGGFAVMMDDTSLTANGYFIWLRPSNQTVNLYVLENGSPHHRIGSAVNMEAGSPIPQAGSAFKVEMSSDGSGHHFDCYVNDQFVGSISDPNKEQGNTAAHFAGVNLKGNLNNNVDDFMVGTLGEVDGIPPATITDLNVGSTSITSVILNWSAVGDDGMDGTASYYDARYSTDPINDGNDFEAADQVTGEPSPSAPGTIETCVVSGLATNTTYYLAVKVFDEAGNSSLSNSVSATTKSANVVTDHFDRTDLGADWNADPEFQIVNEELANTSIVEDWNFVAVYNGRANPVEVSFKWGAQASSAGIEEGGMALMMDAASPNANGYALWIRPSIRRIMLWTIVNGEINSPVESADMEGGAPTPQAGFIFKVQISSDAQGNYFDCFINDQYAGRVSDAAKLQGTAEANYAGVILKGGKANNIDDFSEVNVGGDPALMEYVSGNSQFGTIGQALPGSLVVRITDENSLPVPNVSVDYRIIQGDATLDLAPPDNNVRIEAEAGTITPQMTIGFDDEASGGRFVYGSSGEPKEGKVEYTVNLPISGTYSIWGRIYSPSGLEDSFFFVVDGSADTLLWDLATPYSTWRWAKFEDRTTGVYSQYLNAGQHTFSLIKRENNARMDKIIFSADPGFVPSGREEVPSYITDISGEAKAELTLGSTVGNIIVQAEVAGLEGSPIVFDDLYARAGDAVRMEYVSGNGQSGTGGQLLGLPFKVQLFDSGSNPVFGWEVTFQDVQGGGFPSEAQPVVTDESGVAQTQWTLGTEHTDNIIHAISDGLTGSPVIFNATASGGVADSMMYVSGDGQSGTAGNPLAMTLKMKVVDQLLGAIQNHRVTFTVLEGGGSLSEFSMTSKNSRMAQAVEGSVVNQLEVLTDADGFAQAVLTLGDTAGIENNVVEASAMVGVEHLKGSPFTFHATANPDIPARIEYVSGNDQTGATNRQLGAPFVIKVTDQYGNGIIPHQVNFVVTQGSGSLSPTGPWYTEAGGLAQVFLTLGPTSGQVNEVQAFAEYNSTPLENSPIVFQATSGNVTSISYVSGNGQTGSAGYPAADSLKVKILDNFGNGVSGYEVTFSSLESVNPGTFNGTSNQIVNVSTDGSGIAKVSFTCGAQWGEPSIVKAIADGLTGSPISFSIDVADLTSLQYVSGTGQTGVVGEPLSEPFKVKVIDELGNSFGNYQVTYTIMYGGGDFSGNQTVNVLTNDVTHIAEATLTLGPTPGSGSNGAEATAMYKGSPLGSPISFVATSTIGEANELTEFGGNYISGVVGNQLEEPFVVKVIDASGNAVPGHTVTFTVKTGNGTLDGPTQTTVIKQTGSNGQAQVYLTLGLEAGVNNNSVEAVSYQPGTAINLVGSPLTFYASGLSSPATQLQYASGNGQAVSAVRTALAQPFKVKVTDNHNNAVPDHPVKWSSVVGNGTFGNLIDSITTTMSDQNGFAQVTYYPGPVAGIRNEVVAESWNGPELSGSPVTFYIDTKAADVSPSASDVAGTGPIPADGSAQSTITVTLTDDYGNRIEGKALSMFVSGSSNIITPFTALTDFNGQATAYLASTRAETKTISIYDVTDGINLQTTAQVQFLPLAAHSIGYVSGTNQTSNYGTACNDPIKARVVDVHGNVIASYPVFFEAYLGGGSIYESQPVYTDSNGIASAYWILGPSGEVNRARAVANSLGGSPVEYIATAKAGVAAQLQYISGNEQTGIAGYTLAEPLKVKVADNSGDPISNYPVLFAVDFGEGKIDGKSSVQIYTNVFGCADGYFTIGRVAGPNIASAEAQGLSGSPKRFTAIGVSGPAEKIIKHSGDQSHMWVQAGKWIYTKVTDIYDNPVAGFDVNFSIIKGDAQIQSEYKVVTSNADGIAGSIIRSGDTVEEVQALATATGLIGDGLIFTVYVGARPAVSMEVFHGNEQEGTIERELVYPLSVIVRDEYGNPAAGQNIPITFSLVGDEGILLDPQPAVSDENGIASTRLKLQDATGEMYRVWAIKNGLTGSPLEFTASGVINKFPMYSSIPDYIIQENQSISFTVQATDDDGEPITYGIRDLPSGANFDSLGTRQFSWQPDYYQAGDYTVHFMAWDNSGGFDDEPVNITVQNVNRQPQIINYEPIAYQVVGHWDIGEIFRFMVQAIDVDNDVLSYEWYNNDLLVSTKNYYDCEVLKQALSSHTIVAKVSDGYDIVEHTWVLFVKVPVELASFSGNVIERKGVELHWETTAEHNHAGFNLYRKSASNGGYEKINVQLIKPGDTKQYDYLDRNVKVGQTYHYKLEDVSLTGEKTMHESITVFVTKPKKYSLSQNYPNPFNSSTQIQFQMPDQKRVEIKIYNILGQEIKTLVDETLEAGYHSVIWNGLDKFDNYVSSGVYYYRIVSGDFAKAKKMVFLK